MVFAFSLAIFSNEDKTGSQARDKNPVQDTDSEAM